MRCRAPLVATALVVAALAALPAAARPPGVGSSFYVVDPDPRMCPSPLCGGYWVALANHRRTRCSDGALRARCYVARAVDERRHPLARAIPAGSLARAGVEPWRFEGLGELGMLVVARAFEPVGGAKPTGHYYRLVDTRIRCIREPCFSMRAAALNRSSRSPISGLVLSTLGEQRDLEERVLTELGTRNGVLVRGRIVVNPSGGRELHAARFYLRSER